MIIVTGAAGFIGSAFLAELNLLGEKEIIAVDDLGTSTRWKNLLGKQFLEYFQKDQFLDLIERGKFPKARALIHLGACSSTLETNVDYLVSNNYRYSVTLARWALENDIRFIYASSAATYGDGSLGYDDSEDGISQLHPLNPYGFSKQLFDLFMLRQGYLSKAVGLKFFNVFGPNEQHKGEMRSVVSKAFDQIKANGKVQLFKSSDSRFTDGGQMRDFIYVRDCCDIMHWLIKNKSANGIFNLGTGKARTFNDLVTAVFSAMERKPLIEYIPMPAGLSAQYQNFTEAKMQKLTNIGAPTQKFRSLEDAVTEYVQRYLEPQIGM